MRSNDGTAFRFRQVIKKCFKEKKGKRRWEYLMHATNLERRRIKRTMEDVPEEYKKRWGVENNFKSIEQIRAHTCSQNHSIRVFMLFLSLAVRNLQYTTVRKMNEVIENKLGRHVKKKICQLMYSRYCSSYQSRGS